MKETTGQVIKAFRMHFNYKQDYVAAKIDITTKTFANIERGRVSLDIEKLYRISKVFHIPSRTLFQLIIEIYDCPENSYHLSNAIKQMTWIPDDDV